MPTVKRPSRLRLSPDVRPVDYDIHLDPDLESGRFRGEVRIHVRLGRSRPVIVLHAAELAVERASAEVGGTEVKARASVDRAAETVTLRFARPLPAGEAILKLTFNGRLNQHLR